MFFLKQIRTVELFFKFGAIFKKTLFISLIGLAYSNAVYGQTSDYTEPVSIEVAQSRGFQIFMKDLFAIHATKIVQKDDSLDYDDLQGWITELHGDMVKSYFIGGEYPAFSIKHEIQFIMNEEPKIIRSPEIPADIIEKLKARTIAARNLSGLCDAPYDLVLLDEGDKYLVYALAKPEKVNIVKIGRHYRTTIDKKNLNIVKSERLSFDCLEKDLNDNKSDKDYQVIPIMHHVTDGPLETHVYLGMYYNEHEITVITKNGLYWSKDGKLIHIER